ncbi:hypothetical protein FRACYDRAFT_250051 [Fragilariopsis cylindrus CCMP1102]|uniref:Uncharacterized protein n=1 Tax=Fragilariopsis cylindrus CCMP1102 TaxID=635003 RepID=A0A1E7ERT5_9STRA|nr:hypothetical protein FRACYDRAFT_250051 [Fragilariopsis cylindrus CCMP1102]|eukprot:OEU08263.1 hypothetical protein FRACYDRAFT_250051 [Fragilariopsis cylindrus CCMP1102]
MTAIEIREGNGSNNSTSLWTYPWRTTQQTQNYYNNSSSKSRNNTRSGSMTMIKQRSSTPNGMSIRNGILFILCLFILISFFLFRQMDENMQTYLLDLNVVDVATTVENKINKNKNLKLAVLVAGSTQRFLFDSFVEHVVKPTSNSNSNSNNSNSGSVDVDIDYFAILTLKSGPAFRQEDGYMNHLTGHDKMFQNINFNFSNTNDSVESIQKSMYDTMTNAIKDVKGTTNSGSSGNTGGTTTLRALRLLEEPIEKSAILDDVTIRERKKWNNNANNNAKDNAEYDLYAHFPMKDYRPKAMVRTKAGNKNMIRLFLALESLYDTEFLHYEKKEKSTNYYYDYVLILRDDTLWLNDFDLQAVLQSDSTADAYILSCNHRQPPMLLPEMNDHGILIKRNKANIVGKYITSLSEYPKINLNECHESVEQYMGKNNGDRGCNSEMLLKFILEKNKINVKLVDQSLLPFQRSVLIHNQEKENENDNDNDNDNDDYYCYHKFCQSIENPLQLPNNIKKCKELLF